MNNIHIFRNINIYGHMVLHIMVEISFLSTDNPFKMVTRIDMIHGMSLIRLNLYSIEASQRFIEYIALGRLPSV